MDAELRNRLSTIEVPDYLPCMSQRMPHRSLLSTFLVVYGHAYPNGSNQVYRQMPLL